MLYTATDRRVKSTPRKVGLVARAVCGMRALDAMRSLYFCQKKAALAMRKLLSSAMHNAQNNFGVNAGDLFIRSIDCGKSMTLRRFSPRARGRSSRVLKIYSTVTIKLSSS